MYSPGPPAYPNTAPNGAWEPPPPQSTRVFGILSIVFAALVLGATVVCCCLPIWGRHGNGPPIPGVPASYEIHAHPIWELGHVH